MSLKLQDFAGRHQGETIIICGCGRSLTDLRDPARFITIGVNDVGRLFDPFYLVVVNSRGQFKGDRFRYVEHSRAKFVFSQFDLHLAHAPTVQVRLGQRGGIPLSILDLIGFRSLSYEMAAYLSLMMEEGMNMFIVGESASGKTSLLNAVTAFMPSNHKIVSIEDTPELQVPHANWLREVAKAPAPGEPKAQVDMFDLLKAALRQRPNVIIVGEIRGEEGTIAFNAMQTGHEVLSTFHASNVEKLIQRLTGYPINVPKAYIDNLNVVVCQNNVKLANGEFARRATSISEIVGYDPVANLFSYVEVFRWDPASDSFDFVGKRNSYLLEEKIAMMRGIPAREKWQIYNVVERRARILEKLHKDKGVSDFYELLKVLAKAQEQGIF